jgi:hypothetical protein
MQKRLVHMAEKSIGKESEADQTQKKLNAEAAYYSTYLKKIDLNDSGARMLYGGPKKDFLKELNSDEKTWLRANQKDAAKKLGEIISGGAGSGKAGFKEFKEYISKTSEAENAQKKYQAEQIAKMKPAAPKRLSDEELAATNAQNAAQRDEARARQDAQRTADLERRNQETLKSIPKPMEQPVVAAPAPIKLRDLFKDNNGMLKELASQNNIKPASRFLGLGFDTNKTVAKMEAELKKGPLTFEHENKKYTVTLENDIFIAKEVERQSVAQNKANQ